MSNSTDRVTRALAHQAPDRTPLFEIFSPFHPIHWEICGRNAATDMGLAWDAMADGIPYPELLEANIKAQYQVNRYFGVDMVRLNGGPAYHDPPPVKTGPGTWTLNGVPYRRDAKTDLVVLENPAAEASYSHRYDEAAVRRQLEVWDGRVPEATGEDPVLAGVRRLAQADGVEWTYMGEIGAGTGVAFYPPFLLMWMIDEPELFRRWLDLQKAHGLAGTRRLVASGCTVIAMGGDVSCDKGPFISPALYREFILPVIQEHVDLIHALGATAVYTSDGNHWPIRDEFFFASRIDGYKEVDQAAGMTWPRLIEEGVADRVCIVGNLDARHNLCHGTPATVAAEVVQCLDYGRRARGGHILHASHSVHEDMPVANYRGAVAAYRRYFGLDPLPDSGQFPGIRRSGMGDHDDRLKAMRFEHPEYIPVGVGILPAAWMKYRGDLDRLVQQHPVLFGPQGDGRDYDAVGGTYVAGEHVDAWGCVWSNIHHGNEAIVTGHPVPTRAEVRRLRAPAQDIGFPHGFMYLRLADLRGFEELMVDFAEEPPELQLLLDTVLAYNLRQARLRLAGMDPSPTLVHFGDDLGMQHGLAIGAAKWRRYLKPCYRQIYEPFVRAGHAVYMHTDGHILDIIPDLIECGVRVLNPQIRANGLDGLVTACRGRVCVDLDLDRQLFPFCAPAAIDDHVREAVERLGSPAGGLWLKAEINDDIPLANIEAIFAALEKYRAYFHT